MSSFANGRITNATNADALLQMSANNYSPTPKTHLQEARVSINSMCC